MIPRMKTTYLKTIRPALMARFGFTNTMQAPRLAKIAPHPRVVLLLDGPRRKRRDEITRNLV